ncbi:MAG TPA: thioredoxin family protein, partial [Terriglobales bacterium]|nr:thioredoxin family protein [Terriglobales bacterium]
PTTAGPKTRYVVEQQAWQQQGDQWRIVLASHSGLLKMRQVTKPNPNLYPKPDDARAEIAGAIGDATKNHKHVILVFGGNWCYDCHVLDAAFHQPDVQPLVDKNFNVVHVNIGDDGKQNADLVTEYKIPLDKGVPAIAVLDSDGKLLYSQQNGEWESARSMDPDDIIAFLNKWKP